MTTTNDTPSEKTGTPLTKEIYDEAVRIKEEEGGDLVTILKNRFNVLNINPYEHYYGYNQPLD